MLKRFFTSQFFRDATGALSQIRLLVFVIVVTVLTVWVGINVVAVIVSAIKTGIIDVVDIKPQMAYVILFAVLGKAVQAFAERSDTSTPNADGTDAETPGAPDA